MHIFSLSFLLVDHWPSILVCISRSTSLGVLGGHWTSAGSTAIMSCDRNSVRCMGSKGCLKTLKDQAGSLYLSTGRTMCFSLETTHGSEYFTVNTLPRFLDHLQTPLSRGKHNKRKKNHMVQNGSCSYFKARIRLYRSYSFCIASFCCWTFDGMAYPFFLFLHV